MLIEEKKKLLLWSKRMTFVRIILSKKIGQ